MSAKVVVVTGTGTDVGKTVVSAALVACYRAAGRRVAVVKPTQTGIPAGGAGDLDDIRRLAGQVETHEYVRLPDPLAPDLAARRIGRDLPSVADHARRIAALADCADLDIVLVEGAGGLLVRLDAAGGTLADLTGHLDTTLADGPARVLLVVAAGLGTLNHAALTAEAVTARGLTPAGLVIGAMPAAPGLAETLNVDALPEVTGWSLRGIVPAGAGALPREVFAAAAPGWFGCSHGKDPL